MIGDRIELNDKGVPVFSKGDTRRLFVVLAAIEELKNPTLLQITERTGYPKSSVADALKKIERGELGVVLDKDGPCYSIKDRGKLVSKITFEKLY